MAEVKMNTNARITAARRGHFSIVTDDCSLEGKPSIVYRVDLSSIRIDVDAREDLIRVSSDETILRHGQTAPLSRQ